MPAASSGRPGPVSTPPTGPTSGATCAFNSFTAGTLILLADGTTTPIEQVTLGDRVAATDPETGATASEPVVAVIHGTGMKDLVSLTVTGEDGTTGVVEATEGHPIWTTRGWLIAGALLIVPLQAAAGIRVHHTNGTSLRLVPMPRRRPAGRPASQANRRFAPGV